MADWWYVIVVAGLAIAGIRYLRSPRAGRRSGGDPRRAGAPTRRDYAQERDDDRVAGMSAEDRAWEAASLQRDRETRARGDNPAEQRA